MSLIGVLAAYFLLPLRRLEEVPAGLSLTAAVVLLGGFGVRAIVGAARTAQAGR